MKNHESLHEMKTATALMVGLAAALLVPARAQDTSAGEQKIASHVLEELQAQDTSSMGARIWKAPSSAAHNQNPVPPDAKSYEAGRQVYTQNCQPCHGIKGDGDGPIGMFLKPHPAILCDSKMCNQTDGELFWKIREGKTPMPSFRDALSKRQCWQVINYIRTLAPKPADEVQAATTVPPEGNGKIMAETSNREVLARQNENSQAIDELTRTLFDVKKMARDANPGTTKMLIGGYGTAAGSMQKTSGAPYQKVFTAAFNPLFLWKLSDRLFFEGEIELELEGTATTVNMEVSQVSYLLNDYMTLGAGRFLNPMNYFVEQQHMGWVNRMPDKPLAVYDGLLPESMQGLQLRGGIPAGPVKFEYSAFIANAPTLTSDTAPAEAGKLAFDDLDNSDNHLALGGRLGFFPIPEFEAGYGFLAFRPGPYGSNVMAILHSVDVNYVREFSPLYGVISLRGQWTWSRIDTSVMSPVDSTDYRNNRDGGYVQLSFRPVGLGNATLASLEPVFRYDRFNQLHTPVGFDEWRWAVGLDYWLLQNVVIKGAFVSDHQNGSGQNGNTFLFEFITGL